MISEPALKLVLPTDFLILEALEEHGRNVATNLEYHTGKTRKNINNRLPHLEDHGLVEKIGPADKSGLYELTKMGEIAIDIQDLYSQDPDEFEEELSRRLQSEPDT